MTLKHYLAKAQQEHFAIPAFNAANIATIKAIIKAAQNLNSPVIIQASPRETNYLGARNLVSIINNAKQETNLPLFTNLDHSKEKENTLQALNQGFDLIHFDASHLPLSQNTQQTHQIVNLAHPKKILIEAEMDTLAGSSTHHPKTTSAQQLKHTRLTDPDQAQQFLTATQADILAVSIGNLHGTYQTPPQLDIQALTQISQKTKAFLSLHGGSGIPDQQVKAAITAGIVKINVNTSLRLAFRQALAASLKQNQEIAIYKIMPPVIKALQQVVEAKILLFGSQNKAS